MIRATVTIKGTEALVNGLKRLPLAVRRRAEEIVKETAWLIHNDAKYMCPVDTGRLRSSVSVNWSDSGMERGEVKGEVKVGKSGKEPKPLTSEDGVGQPPKELYGFYATVGTNVEYAPYVEDFSPYLWPAFAMNRGRFLEKLKSVLGRELERK